MTRNADHRRRLDVVAAVRDGVRATPRVWNGAWGVLGLVSLLAVIPVALTVEGHVRTGLTVALGATIWVAWGALSRIGTARSNTTAWAEGLGPSGFQFGKTELRLLAALLLNLIFIAMILTVLALAALVVAGVAELDVEAIRARDWAAAGSPARVVLVSMVMALTVWVPLAYVIRLSLFAQATVGRGHAVSLNTLGIAQGSFWGLAALNGLVGGMIALLLAAPSLLGDFFGPITTTLGLIWIVAPFAAGALGAAYRQLEYWTPQGGAR